MRFLLVPVLQPQLGVHDVTEVPVHWAIADLEEGLLWPLVHTPLAPGSLCTRRCAPVTGKKNHGRHHSLVTVAPCYGDQLKDHRMKQEHLLRQPVDL